ncbi:hypothetical protein BT63DRAFT_61629 [Microthyrium microscopicum]|uniref:Uncharacterized protein n=1 Tax=Microthyrium microscopicum TaxID=703497 RepID=A0A6A6U2G1_9PEZI|nr:hypothetical protein BT63DRAFT_61629 [Microthyrium microscopicum]
MLSTSTASLAPPMASSNHARLRYHSRVFAHFLVSDRSCETCGANGVLRCPGCPSCQNATDNSKKEKDH